MSYDDDNVQFGAFNLSGMWMTLCRFNDILYIRTAFRSYRFSMVFESKLFGTYLTQAQSVGL